MIGRIIYVILVALLLSACATNTSHVGRVNKHWIDEAEFVAHLRFGFERHALEHNFAPNTQQRRQIADETWDRIVEGYVILDLFNRYNISVSTREVLDTLRTNIPELMLNSPRFTDENGLFDMETYLSSLMTDRPIDLAWLRDHYRTTIIPTQKLQNLVIARRRVSEREIRDFYALRYSEVDMDVFLFNSDSVCPTSITVTDREIEVYYENNRFSFFVEPSIDLNWVTFSVSPSENDLRNVQNLADSLFNEINSGQSFASLARSYSAQPYARLGGAVGFMAIDDFHQELAQKIRSSTEGEAIPPILLDNAWWIIRVEERTPNMARLNIIKLEITPSRETIEATRRDMERFVELSNIIGFPRAASELRLELFHQSGLSMRNSVIPSLGNVGNVLQGIMGLPERTVLTPILIADEEFYVIFQIDGRADGRFRRIYEAMDEIHDKLKQQKILEEIVNVATSHRNNTNMTSRFESRQIALNYTERQGFSHEFAYDALGRNAGQTTNVFFDGETAFYGRILAKRPMGYIPPLSMVRDQLKAELQTIGWEEYYRVWLQAQMRRARVRDLRPADLF